MITQWGEKLEQEMVLQEYPRPQMMRESYLNLNGIWSYAITESADPPAVWDGAILVPFSPECPLSGVEKTLFSNQYLWYQRMFLLPEAFNKGRVLLHFGAVDQEAVVYLNHQEVGRHTGGYLPFCIDITEYLTERNLLEVRVQDNTDEGYHTHGKQRHKRGGMWYTPQSGIWQTVWMESVPETYIKRLIITPKVDKQCVEIGAEIVGKTRPVAHFHGVDYPLPARIPAEDLAFWTPENPELYSFTVTCEEDTVLSYFAYRSFSVEKDEHGVPRLFLNGTPFFHNGLLDQGYWPDGLYTPPSDAAMVFDIQTAKDMGFNMLRKHMKIEPLRWYYHCDRIGMLVWQDAPCGANVYNPLVISAPLVTGKHRQDNAYTAFGRENKAGREEFRQEVRDMVRTLYNCPCIAMWVPFNEGWGQFDAEKVVEDILKIDRSRLIDHASGWHDQKIGDIQSLHVYFRKYRFRPDKLGRAVVLSEFGGYNHQVFDHTFSKKDFGYKKLESPLQLENALQELYEDQIVPAWEDGLSAAVYTQLTDVEDELNGLITYDRKVVKIPPARMAAIVKVE